MSVHRDPRINGEEGKTTGRSVHRRSAIPFSSSEHPLSFHRSELRSKVHAMTATSRTGEKISSNRLAACAAHGCNRPFAVCGGCDRGRKFCSRVCANSARRESLRRAGRQYQATARGRSLHATRQARYRDRQRAVTHQSRVAEPNFLENSPKYGSVVASTTGASPGLCVPPRCAFCRQSGVFLRNGFIDRSPRRNRQRRATRNVRVQHGHAIRAAGAWPFETLGSAAKMLRSSGAEQQRRRAQLTNGGAAGAR